MFKILARDISTSHPIILAQLLKMLTQMKFCVHIRSLMQKKVGLFDKGSCSRSCSHSGSGSVFAWANSHSRSSFQIWIPVVSIQTSKFQKFDAESEYLYHVHSKKFKAPTYIASSESFPDWWHPGSTYDLLCNCIALHHPFVLSRTLVFSKNLQYKICMMVQL